MHGSWFCSSQNANFIICVKVKCGLCCSLYGLRTSSDELVEKYGLKVFDSRVHGEVFGTKDIELTGDWKS